MTETIEYVSAFADQAAQQVALSGGKGANLARLTGAGFNVPHGIVVTRAAYDIFLAQAGEDFARCVAKLDYSSPAALAGQTGAIQDRLRALPLPADVREQLAGRLAQLQALGVARVSVRSSATAEDTASAAFAGQHETYLNVSPGDVPGRIKDCWISLWSDRAVMYRHHAGIGALDTSMAVVVQTMVEAEVAGVAFSVDPVAGRLHTVVVDANFGLGESVVSGEAEVDHWEVDKATGTIVSQRLAEKSRKVVSLADGGTGVVVLDAHARLAPSLSPEQLSRIGQLAGAIERFYGFPQDIEWAIAGGELYVLQARPITSIAPRWTREESAERFPNPVSPLAWDLVEDGFHKSLNYSFDLMGLPPFEGKWFAMFDSYIYGNQNAVELYANGVPLSMSSVDELRALLPTIAERYGWVQELPLRWSRDLDWYLLRLGEFNAKSLSGLSLKGLWAHALEVSDTGARYFLPNIAISITQRALYKILQGMLGLMAGPAQAPALFDALMAHCDTKTGAINAELYRLARQVQDNAAFFARHDNATLLANWRSLVTRELPGFVADFDRLLAEHGHRETEFDPYVPTWLEAPEVVLSTLRVMAQGALRNPHENDRQLKQRMQETLFALQQQVPQDLRYFFTEVVRLAQTYTSLDDLEHYQTTRLTLPLRRALRELGGRLHDLGVAAEPMDVFFARLQTLDSAICNPTAAQWSVLAAEIGENKLRHERARNRTPPWNLNEDETFDPAGDEGWQGIPGSPGKVSGSVYLVHGTDDFGRFPKDAVLVARTTNPAWTPLFYGACAVVTESGGPLSHGAVTARELQKPAVMGVRAIMQSVKNGQQVEVDGSRGTVRPIPCK